MIKTIYLKNLRNNEFIQYCDNFQQIILTNNPEALKVQDQYNAINEPLSLLQITNKKLSQKSFTVQLFKIDKRRDAALRSIYNIVDAYTHHYNEEVCAKAIDLKKELDVYGKKIIHYNYQYETSAIDDILTKWEPKAEGIATLNLTDWVNELKEANTLFNECFLDKVKVTAEDADIKVIELRNTITARHNELIDYLKSYALIEKTENYTTVIGQINELINQYNKTITARHSKKSASNNIGEDASADITNENLAEN